MIFFGAANPETVRVIKAIEGDYPSVGKIAFLDNDQSKWGKDLYGYPILGGMERVPDLCEEHTFVNIITGSTKARHEVSLGIKNRGGNFGTLIHPSVDVFLTDIDYGAYIQENVVIQAECELGWNCSVHAGTVVGHETKIGKSVFIAHGCAISGCCEIGDGTFIGAGSTVLPRKKIGKWCIIGAGAVVTKDVPDYSVMVGNPARFMRVNDLVPESERP